VADIPSQSSVDPLRGLIDAQSVFGGESLAVTRTRLRYAWEWYVEAVSEEPNSMRASIEVAARLQTRLRRGLVRRLRLLLRLWRLYLIRAELRWIPNESQRLFALTVVVGIVCGFAAVAFHLAIQVAERLLIEPAMNAPNRTWIGWTIATPTIGAAICGLLLQYVVPNARGSGIPLVKSAFAGNGERLRMRDSLGKFLIGALQIGSGSSLGREGPTVQICAGLASTLGRLVGVSPKSLRRLIPVGAAAGIAAAFNAPIAAVTFTVEEVLGNLDQAMLSGVIVAAALAAVIERNLLGEAASIHETYSMGQLQSLLICLAIGLGAAMVSLTFTGSLLRLRKRFRVATWLPEWSRPAVGGMATGLLAVVALYSMHSKGITGGGYTTLGRALNGELTLRVMLVLCLMKLAATVFSYSSGGAGGIFAPALFIGAMLGGSLGSLGHRVLHGSQDPLGAFALVGMGAVFAGIIRAPMTSVLIVVEMSGSYSLILPLMIANATSYVIARRLSPMPIYEALLAQDGVRLKHHAEPDSLESKQVSAVAAFEGPLLSFSSTTRGSDMLDTWRANKAQDVYPVLDETRRILGIVTLDDLTLLATEPELVLLANVSDLMRPPLSVKSEDSLTTALESMVAHGIRDIPVTNAEGHLIGILDEASFAKAYLRMRGSARDGQQTTPEISTEV
jgi:chloride channel protein, CIC family